MAEEEGFLNGIKKLFKGQAEWQQSLITKVYGAQGTKLYNQSTEELFNGEIVKSVETGMKLVDLEVTNVGKALDREVTNIKRYFQGDSAHSGPATAAPPPAGSEKTK